jgi:hypothetical protein
VRSGGPIEQAFANLKALLRAAPSRTVETLWQALGHALDALSPAACAHYLAHAGWVPPDGNDSKLVPGASAGPRRTR